MKLIIDKNILMENLNHVIKGVSSKNLIPVLNCIKFELKEDGLYLMSTDNDISIRAFIPNKLINKVENLGTVVVSGRYIYEIIRKLPNELINIEEVVDSRIYVYTKNSSFYLNCHNKEEFPNLTLEETKQPIKLAKPMFKKIIKQVLYAASTQEDRPALTGVNFKIDGDNLDCISTDSYRLAKKTIKLDDKVSENINIIIPTKNLSEVSKIVDDNVDMIDIHIFSNKVIFKFDNLTILSRLINATFPDVTSKLPTNFKLDVTMDLNEFYSSIDRASLLSSEIDKNPIKLETLENEIKISSTIPEIGKVEETISAQFKTDQNFIVSFSSKFIMDAIKSLDGEQIQLFFNEENSPFIVKDPSDETLTILLSPIRTR